jgi:hypothetical protein
MPAMGEKLTQQHAERGKGRLNRAGDRKLGVKNTEPPRQPQNYLPVGQALVRVIWLSYLVCFSLPATYLSHSTQGSDPN